MKPSQEALLGRDIIVMILAYKDDADVLEHLHGLAVSLAQGLEGSSIVPWYDIAAVCDQRYYSLKQGNPIDLNEDLLQKCEKVFSSYLPQ